MIKSAKVFEMSEHERVKDFRVFQRKVGMRGVLENTGAMIHSNVVPSFL
jgi:hypothetical protein